MTEPTTDLERMRQALALLGWNQSDLARKLGMTAKQVSSWATGKTPVPSYVLAFLDLSVVWDEARQKYPGLLH